METAHSDKLFLQQALHGYRDGHRLLSASFQPTSEERAILLSLTDMSGPSMAPGFENYITGYPLTNLEMYAVAATWYAPEMRRPGCVWTHTLFIRFEDLSKISSLETIIRFFVRPQ